ncbi:MAG: 50S ribosomal protein L22 [Ilumatobacteraceae bacterium]|jgi:large subunit ribosomal protein L22
MTGPKLNERSFVAGERSGTRATAKHIHAGAWKARVVLDLIRGLPVRQADEVLQFTDRDVAVVIRKVLASAVANAQHNDEQDPEELYVKACYADEGPTMKRFTPRARGRAGRIKKRTTHITIIVDRLDDDRLEVVQARLAKRTATGRRRGAAATSAASRRERVARSRQRAASLKDADADTIDSEATEADEELLDTSIESTDVLEAGEGSASDEPDAARDQSEAEVEPAADPGSASDEPAADTADEEDQK